MTGNSISDHLAYFGVHMGCDTWRSCGIVMDPQVVEYRKTDFEGNFILSRNPATPTVGSM